MKLIYLLPFIYIASAMAKPCGLEGSIDERIKDCATTKGQFALVAQDEKGLEVYKDTKSGLVWGNRINTDFNHYGSQKACASDTPEVLAFKDLKWRLPTIKEFEQSASHGMKASLPNMNHWFWTSTPVARSKKYRRKRSIPSQVYLWDGMGEVSDTGDLKEAASVRCVAKD